MTDPLEITKDLIRCPSVTPEDAGALSVIETILAEAGFNCVRVDRGAVCNLFARYGEKAHPKTFGFNGHTDVVPPGPHENWRFPPFSPTIEEDQIWGRGAADMKSGVAAFVSAAVDFVSKTPPDGAVILAITGDEEGEARDGTRALLDWMEAEGESMAHCLVGEPTCPDNMGEMIKIGRRGSMTVFFEAQGVQGHSAYPHRAKNAAHAMVQLVNRLSDLSLDQGSEHFDPSTLVLTTIDVGNPATNVVPGTASATVNIRFNDCHSSDSLTHMLRDAASRVTSETGVDISIKIKVSGESFFTKPGPFVDLVRDAVEKETGTRPVLSTSGGTSDARFVKRHCPVLEFGLVGKTMHQVDERVDVAHIHALKAVYARILRDYFSE